MGRGVLNGWGHGVAHWSAEAPEFLMKVLPCIIVQRPELQLGDEARGKVVR